ncbi:MAG: hypothetical protein HC856_06545 [Pseudanabaena sp. RU_4_16]|nr:hypothetical protein [Pseudanabaena sp. RU_4_16]
MAIVSGTGNDDVLLAGATGDTLIGRGGADALIAGVGTDILTGEAGYDQFIFRSHLQTL